MILCVCSYLGFLCSQIVLAVVACGDRLSETLVMIKSAILFTQKPLNFIVLADDLLIPSFKEKV
jgi:UDP-xylose:glucoside alpha-1,3-xylosyltransferase